MWFICTLCLELLDYLTFILFVNNELSIICLKE
jgi:hypothetical protein